MEIYVNISFISIFFLVFNHDFILYINFSRIAASNTATDDVTNQVTRRIFKKIIIDEKSSLTGVLIRFNDVS